MVHIEELVKGGPFTEFSKYCHPDCGLNLDRNATATATLAVAVTATAVRTLLYSLKIEMNFKIL